MRSLPFLGFGLAAAAALALAAAPAAAQPSEAAVKAAFLAKFGHYVVWPPRSGAAGQPFNLCVIGKDGFGALLDKAVAGQRINGRPIAVHRLPSVARASGCNMAFVNGGASTAQMVGELRRLPVLVVTDGRNGNARGMIHFAVHDGRVGFHVDQAMANASQLSISSRLLGLALSVKEGRR